MDTRTNLTGATPTALDTLDPTLVERLLRHVAADGGRELLAVEAPFTGEVLGHVPVANAEDVAIAVERARKAQEGWAAQDVNERAAIFRRLHDMILDRRDEILDLMQLETGKARRHAFEEVLDVAITSRYYANVAGDVLAPVRRRGALPLVTETYEYRHPKGVVGFIAPWNYPLTLAISDAIPALLAGNAIVLKPDRQTPFTALWIVDLLVEAGIPDDIVQVTTGAGATLGTPLIENVDYVCFTGSTATGRTVAIRAAERLIGYSMELGGKNAMLVLDDADLDRAVEGAVVACFANAGQLCISIERLYVHASLYDEFVERFTERAGSLRLGPGFDWDVEMGSLISMSQLDTMRDHVEDAVDKGASVLAGGKPRSELGPYFHEPTVLAGVKAGMKPYREETFGPLVSIYEFSTDDEVLALANDTEYGLNASVWTKNLRHGREIAQRINAGTVNVNEGYAATWGSLDAPMGGFKDSGVGRRHGEEGILKYTEPQTVATQRFLQLTGLPGLPQSQFAPVMSTALKVLRRIPGMK